MTFKFNQIFFLFLFTYNQNFIIDLKIDIYLHEFSILNIMNFTNVFEFAKSQIFLISFNFILKLFTAKLSKIINSIKYLHNNLL